RAKDGVEFIASTDVWFRPCNFANAPDGNLYMTDIYREFIETPVSIPEEIKKNMDFYAGANMGRIWRIVSNHPLRQGNLHPQLGKASTAELVQLLASTNGWHQTTAQRLLADRQDHTAVPLLQEMAAKNANPVARVRALWTLEALNAAEPALVLQLLKDSDAHVRAHAIRVAEEVASKSKPVADQLRAMVQDPEPRVQFQLALSLGQLNDRSILEPLARLALAHQDDRWFRTAILSSAADSAEPFFQILTARKFSDAPFLTELASMIGAKHDPAELARFFQARGRLSDPLWAASLTGLGKGLKLGTARSLRVPSAEAALEKSLNSSSPDVQAAAWEASRYFDLPGLLRRVSADVLAANLPIERRVLAVRALRGGSFSTTAPLITRLLATHPQSELQSAAVDTLSSYDDQAVGPMLLDNWKTFAPEARKKTVDALLNHKERVPMLLKALRDKQIESSFLDLPQRARLISNPDATVAKEARQLIQSDTSERAKVVASYQDAVKLNGNVDHGKAVFDENCAKCHMPRKQGGRVGPDLSGVNNKTKEELINSILNPSAAIEPRFTNYMVTTKDGRMYDGVIANETPGAITLRSGDTGDETILRKNITDVRASSISLMPEGLERSLNKQDLADVIAYLRAGL
ncbi:MAG TPA: HEAT repeat domain-containing protein, partial [Bryobacteraceae bacterium]|nr:HEAT repeat domain-containing protein [Bryobacteraceae bacterium]